MSAFSEPELIEAIRRRTRMHNDSGAWMLGKLLETGPEQSRRVVNEGLDPAAIAKWGEALLRNPVSPSIASFTKLAALHEGDILPTQAFDRVRDWRNHGHLGFVAKMQEKIAEMPEGNPGRARLERTLRPVFGNLATIQYVHPGAAYQAPGFASVGVFYDPSLPGIHQHGAVRVGLGGWGPRTPAWLIQHEAKDLAFAFNRSQEASGTFEKSNIVVASHRSVMAAVRGLGRLNAIATGNKDDFMRAAVAAAAGEAGEVLDTAIKSGPPYLASLNGSVFVCRALARSTISPAR